MAALYKGVRGKTIGCFEETISWNSMTWILNIENPNPSPKLEKHIYMLRHTSFEW